MAVITDALVGALVGQLLSAVVEMKDKAVKFGASLEKLQSTLESLGPDMDKIVEFNRKRNRPAETKKIVDLMESGMVLVRECSKKSKLWNGVYKKVQYQEKLEKLNESIHSYIQVQLFKYGLEILTSAVCPPREPSGNTVANIICTPTFITGKCSAPAPPKFTVGMDIPMNDLKLRVLEERVSVSVITLTGSGGSGKTTLARKLCWDDRVKGKFQENVFFITFGKMPKLSTIIQNLFHHYGHAAPEFQSEEDVINCLETFMIYIVKKGPILLVLDDVRLEFEYLVQKFVFPIPNYNIVVTSTTQITRFGHPFVLGRLRREDATSLFLYSASLDPTNSDIPHSIVKKVVKECKGSPLALIVSGTSLKNKNLVVWRNRANALSKGQSILDPNNNVLACLQKSLDVLDPMVIECFKDLSLFPEGQVIPIAALVDMWAELHGEDDETAIYKINELFNLSLANILLTRKVTRDIVGYNYFYATQHGLLRELAICKISQEPMDKRDRLIIEINGNNLPSWWSVQKKYPIAARILSISIDEAFTSKWCNLQPTKVETLVLNHQGKKCTLPMFMKKMDKLKVLTITNYDVFPAKLENFKVLDHLSNLKRLRLEQFYIPFLNNGGVQLKNLKKCSFYMCVIVPEKYHQESQNSFCMCNVMNKAFTEDIIQVSDMLPNLVEMDFDCCNMVELPLVLSNMVLLKNLRLTNCYNLRVLPEGIGKLVNLESLSLSSCTHLSELPDSITSLRSLQFLDISDCISLCELPKDMGKLRNLEKLNVKGCSRLTELPISIRELEDLEDVVCDKEMVELWEPVKEFLSDLRIHVAEADFDLDFLINRTIKEGTE